MGAVKTDFIINDMMTGPLNRMTNAMNTVISQMMKMEGTTSAAMVGAQRDIQKASAQLKTMGKTMQTTGNQTQTAKNKVTGFGASMKGFIKMAGGLWAIQKGFSLIKGSIEAANKSMQEHTKLQEVMKAMQGAGKSDVASVENVMSKEASSGVVGAGAQRSGAQQISTYVHQTAAVRKLIPAMNDLAVQMHGTNVSGEDMVNIANMTGKVYAGQVGALRRAGISFDEHSEKILKNGTEMEKAKELVKVFNQNVGNMNQKMAKTPAGQYKRLQNQLAAVRLEIGNTLIPALSEMAKLLANKESMKSIKLLATVFANAIVGIVKGIGTVVRGFSKVFGWIGRIGKGKKNFDGLASVVQKIARVVSLGVVAWGAYKTAIAVATVATKIFGVVSKIASMSPMVIVIMAIVAVIIILQKRFKIFNKLGKWFKSFGAGVRGVGVKIRAAFGKLGNSVGKLKKRMVKGFMAAGQRIKKFAKESQRSTFGVKGYLGGLTNFISGVFTGNWKKAWKGVVQMFKSIFNTIKAIAKAPLNGVIWLINKAIDGLNKFHVKVPKGIPGIGGKTFGFNLKHIPQLAKGSNNTKPGMTLVGEQGPELVNMPRGARVHTAGETRKMLSQKSVTVAKLADTIVVREEADIDKIASAIARKLEDMSDNVPVMA